MQLLKLYPLLVEICDLYNARDNDYCFYNAKYGSQPRTCDAEFTIS